MGWTKNQSNAAPAALALNVETTLEAPAITAAATYVLELDLSALANGDTLEARIYKKGPNPAAGLKCAYYAIYSHAQGADEVLKLSVPVPLDDVGNQISFTLKQTSGTGRVVPWLIKSI